MHLASGGDLVPVGTRDDHNVLDPMIGSHPNRALLSVTAP
jgi:hypothetical protein